MKAMLVALVGMVCASLGAEDFDRYDPVLIRDYPVGQGMGEFTEFSQAGWSSGPEAIAFGAEGLLYICDTRRQAMVVADRSYEIREEHKADIGYSLTGLLVDARGFEIHDSMAGLSFLDRSYCKLFEVGFENTRYDNTVVPGGYLYCGDVVFAYLRGGEVVSFVRPGPDWKENAARIRDASETRALLLEPEKHGLQGVTLAAWGRLLVGGENEIRSYRAYLGWAQQQHGGTVARGGRASGLLFDPHVSNDTAEFQGKDMNGNVYWRDYTVVYVFDRAGTLIEMLQSKGGVGIRAVHPSGDLYSLGYRATDGARLHRVRNVWDPKARELWESYVISTTGEGIRSAEVTAGPLRVRRAAGPMAEIEGELAKGDRVEVLWHGSAKEQIDGFDEYWYEVRRKSDGLQGWVYGGYLRIEP